MFLAKYHISWQSFCIRPNFLTKITNLYVIYMYNIYYNIYKCVWPFCGIGAQRVKFLFSQLMMSSAWWFDLNMFLKVYLSLSPSRGFESIDPNLTLSKWLLLPWYEGYQELHNGIWSNCPVQPAHRWNSNRELLNPPVLIFPYEK